MSSITEEQKTSRITILFPGKGSADIIGIKLENVTPGQIAVAAVWLVVTAFHDIWKGIEMQLGGDGESDQAT